MFTVESVYNNHSAIGNGCKVPADSFYTVNGQTIMWIVDNREGSYRVGFLNGTIKNLDPDIRCERKIITFGELEVGDPFEYEADQEEFSGHFEKITDQSVNADGKIYNDDRCVYCGKVFTGNAILLGGKEAYFTHFCNDTTVYPLP